MVTLAKGEEKDFDVLTDVWEAAVRATHDFLSEKDIQYYRRMIRECYLAQVDLTLARAEDGTIIGFMGMAPEAEAQETAPGTKTGHIAMLFVRPDRHGQGIGRMLVQDAAARYGVLELDVNEQNPGAFAFYQKCGFVQTGRSDLDDQGRPFPLLHLRKC